MINPYDAPKTQTAASPSIRRRLDLGVLFIGIMLIAICLASVAGQLLPQLRVFFMPRFGWVGAFIGINALVPMGAWIMAPTRKPLLGTSFMLCAIGLINACMLLASGTVDVVENIFHDRLHSSWIWSVVSFLTASLYTAIVAFRIKPIEEETFLQQH